MFRVPPPVPVLGLLLFALLAASCGGASPADATGLVVGPPPGAGGGADLEGGVLVTLTDAGEPFHIWVTEPVAAQIVVDVWNGEVGFTNITGRLRYGSGPGRHNGPWSWHLDPAGILVNIHTFAPVYSGTPSETEANLAALIAANQDKMTSSPRGSITNVEDRRRP